MGRNVADALIKLGMKSTRLISVVGRDDHGKIILESLGIGGSTVTSLPDVDTARYVVVILLDDVWADGMLSGSSNV